MKTNNAQAGFSLVELMVVVAIIAILSTIAVPNFQRFQARARQTSAKTELAGIYTSEKGFSAEYNSFHGHLPAIGFTPEGVTIAANYPTTGNPIRYYTSSAGGAAVPCALQGAGTPCASMPAAPGAFAYLGFYSSSACAAALNVAAIPGIVAPTASLFTAAVAGCPRSQAANNTLGTADIWTIDQNKAMTNTVSGI